jgi:hypothetical protein
VALSPGVNGFRATKEARERKIAETVERWCEPVGGVGKLTAAEIDLLRFAAAVMLKPVPKASVLSEAAAHAGGGAAPVNGGP